MLAEPARRNTSGCLAFAAAWFLARFDLPPEAISMSVLTSDHRIEDPEAFRATIQGIWQAVERHDALGVVGIKPCRPDTGVGYIEIAAGARPIAESEPDRPIFPVARFREKPNLELAEHFLSTGRCYWNSGMFFWRLSTFLREADRACPRLSQAARAMAQAIRDADSARAAAVFETIEYQSIDIALIERSENVLAAPGLFSWMDVGSWDGYYRAHAKDANGNVATGDPVLVDVRDSVIFNESGSSAFAVSVIGVRDLAVIVSRDALLVVPMSRAQDVRRAVEELESRGARQL
ncbi:MAG: Mannose-1-phosphate guanylyltransferase 1 [candidate division BRC1 bacterium ADurb.BinA364]|nr:MAG: Mannose-1-phosphate guanylyltransferase 1 [candidate division BRC1 bacterium ADurb.BinA364]